MRITSYLKVATGDGRLRLILEILAAMTVAAAFSVGLFLVGYHESIGQARVAHVYRPSGGTIATVWSILFAALAWCRWRALRQGSARGLNAAKWITRLIVLCALYPIYTNGLRSVPLGFIGNLLTAAISARAAWSLRHVNRWLIVAPGVVIIWLVYASALIVDQQRWCG
jgi:tryptophan-rich sensory protein